LGLLSFCSSNFLILLFLQHVIVVVIITIWRNSFTWNGVGIMAKGVDLTPTRSSCRRCSSGWCIRHISKYTELKLIWGQNEHSFSSLFSISFRDCENQTHPHPWIEIWF
jgi:hypothetical protein